MRKFAILLMIVSIMLAVTACGGAEVEPAAPIPSSTAGPALNTVAPTATAVPAATETPMSDESDQTENTPEPATPATVDPSQVTPSPGEGAPEEMTAPGVPSSLQPLANDIKAHLAEQLEIDADAIEVVSIEEVTWNDSSLGCPKPGMNYLMVLTPGFRIVVAAQGKQYEYHTDQNGRFVLCNDGPGLKDTSSATE